MNQGKLEGPESQERLRRLRARFRRVSRRATARRINSRLVDQLRAFCIWFSALFASALAVLLAIDGFG